ncbi:Methyltransferase type 11 [Arabidopsis thaliana x Arabidopsis arenosa]|uniref:Methyltransferase type 11 n=1 Tax=Arabidopsis thaliana x Arabidopsis arenosa TaxID=1240361 RepID=A0A8T1ZQ08_9BRAS|nr:Methyltransferase type 11 [Arabidopsis thaliana x Arabidopsis arenosa]
MGVEMLKLKLMMPSSFRRRVILRALVIICAFSVVSVLRNLGGAYEGENSNNTQPCKVDECAVNFAFLGPFLFSGNGLLSNRFLKPVLNYLESEKCKENIYLTTEVVRELTGMNLLSNDSNALCIGQRSVSAVLAMNRQGISDVSVAYMPPVFAFKHRKFTSELHYEDASFGFVFSMDLETVTVPASLVYEIERILKPGGTGAMLVGTISGSDSNELVRSVSPVSSLLKNSSVVHVASLGEQVLVVFKRDGEDSFRLDQTHHDLPADCSSVLKNRPYIGLLEPLLEEKRSDFERRIHYLPEFIDHSSRKRLVYIDIGAADHVKARSNWFFPSYPIDRKAFNSYFVHHNTSILTSYVKSPGVTFIYHPGLAATKTTTASLGDQEEPFVEDDSFDFLAWFKETASFADFVVLKMNTSNTELKFLSELIKTGAICSVDELFLHCTGYRDCTGIFKSLRNSGVFVHQWWED